MYLHFKHYFKNFSVTGGAINAINDYSTGTITTTFTMNSYTLYKRGVVCFFSVDIDINQSVSSSDTLFSLPSGFRPPETIKLFFLNFISTSNIQPLVDMEISTSGSAQQKFNTTLNLTRLFVQGCFPIS